MSTSTSGKEPMTSARWQRVKEIVADALDRAQKNARVRRPGVRGR